MFERLQPFFSFVGSAGLIAIAGMLLFMQLETPLEPLSFERPQETEVTLVFATSTPETPKEVASAPIVSAEKPKAVPKDTPTTTPAEDTNEARVTRIQNPYPFARKTIATLDAEARGALVNIFCESGEEKLPSTSGSGVLIDSRGIILTNAHVAQYFLLDARPDVSLSCVIRAGAPAKPRFDAELLYIPKAWVDKHGGDIALEHTTGTGEDDYALLFITKSLDSTPLPPQFPYTPFDTREAIAFTGDTVLVAAFPAEFISGQAAKSSLYPATVATLVGDLRTFKEYFVDVISLGGIFVAQGGSSGGGAVNEWGRLVGIISTTSDGGTTADRDLRAVTISHIDRSINAYTGMSLIDFVAKDPKSQVEQFKNESPALAQKLVDSLRSR